VIALVHSSHIWLPLSLWEKLLLVSSTFMELVSRFVLCETR